jgi:hypoxanthine phosphoribosyltransferase
MIYDRILITAEQLDTRITAIAQEIDAAYNTTDDILAMVLLEGARPFARHLLAKLTIPVAAEYLKISSYHGGTKSTGEVILNFPPELCNKICGKSILIIDDIYDTGLTLNSVIEHIRQSDPKDIKTCILLEKQTPHRKPGRVDFLGFRVEDTFVIGYGMDYRDQYRDLPFIATLHPDRIG